MDTTSIEHRQRRRAWLVACLCAPGAETCDEYRPTFAAAAAARPELRFAWIDIEDHSDALGPLALDIDDFPTLLIRTRRQPCASSAAPAAPRDAAAHRRCRARGGAHPGSEGLPEALDRGPARARRARRLTTIQR
jgi:hypothetical protein